jgi:hypothetical protein
MATLSQWIGLFLDRSNWRNFIVSESHEVLRFPGKIHSWHIMHDGLQENWFVRTYIHESIILVLCRIPVKRRKQVLLMFAFVGPKLTPIVRELNASIGTESGD